MKELHPLFFIHHRVASLAAALGLYLLLMLGLGRVLGISSNYFVILTIAVAAMSFGSLGGLVAGILALPANLLVFAFLGHPEYSPASKLVAEIAGTAVGFVFGRLAGYFQKLMAEIQRRVATEEALRRALEDKELLLKEIHHRVKNNLSVIKALVQLQSSRSKDPAFHLAAEELMGRIFAISLVHDQLKVDQEPSLVDPARYLEALVSNLASGLGMDTTRISLSLDTRGILMPTESAISLGLIVNEILTNTLKHACPGRLGPPAIELSLEAGEGAFFLAIGDDGPGLEQQASRNGLGLKLIDSLARSLGGKAELRSAEGGCGARFELAFPQPSPRA